MGQKIHEQVLLQKDLETPAPVWKAFGSGAKKVLLSGSQASLHDDGDYMTVPELREAIEWYVDQLGGEVVWKG